MNLTTEQKKHCAAVRTAAANGEKCEWHYELKEWVEADPFAWVVEDYPDRWRIAPKKVARPWTGPDDVPSPVCWLRNKGVEEMVSMIIGIDRDGVQYVDNQNEVCGDAWDCLAECEYSTDRKTWKACVIEEEQQ